MKIRGAELKNFMDTGWPKPEDDWYWDHDLFESPDPEATYDTYDLGGVHYQGRGEDPTNGEGYNLDTLIRRWRKEQSEKTLVVHVPKGKEDEFKAYLKSIKGRIAK